MEQQASDVAAQAVTAPTAKPYYASRTLWFNAACLALAAAEPLLPGLRDVLPGGLYTWLAFIVPVGNAVCRQITKTGVAL